MNEQMMYAVHKRIQQESTHHSLCSLTASGRGEESKEQLQMPKWTLVN